MLSGQMSKNSSAVAFTAGVALTACSALDAAQQRRQQRKEQLLQRTVAAQEWLQRCRNPGLISWPHAIAEAFFPFHWPRLRFSHAVLEEDMQGSVEGVISQLENLGVIGSLFLGVGASVLFEADIVASKTQVALAGGGFLFLSLVATFDVCLISSVTIIAVNQADGPEEANVLLKRLSWLVSMPLLGLNFSIFFLIIAILLWLWDTHFGPPGTAVEQDHLTVVFIVSVVLIFLFAVLVPAIIIATTIKTLYAVKDSTRRQQTLLLDEHGEASEGAGAAATTPRDGALVVGAAQMKSELEAFLELRGIERATLVEFVRFLGMHGGCGGGGGGGGCNAADAAVYRLAPTTRRRAELFFGRELELRLHAELESTGPCAYSEGAALASPPTTESAAATPRV